MILFKKKNADGVECLENDFETIFVLYNTWLDMIFYVSFNITYIMFVCNIIGVSDFDLFQNYNVMKILSILILHVFF